MSCGGWLVPRSCVPRPCHTRRVTGWQAVPVPEERLDDLEPLWRAFYEHHIEVAPHLRDRLRPFDRAWRAERARLGSATDSFVLAAQDDDRYVGYGLVRLGSSSGFAASWAFSDPLAFLITLTVLPAYRGRGVGSALLEAIEQRLRQRGITDLVIDAVTTNSEAIRLYERRGAVPFVTDYVQRVRALASEQDRRTT